MKRTLGMWMMSAALAGGAVAGELKIAVVDGNRLLKGYYKTELADQHMQQQLDDFQAERDKLLADHKRLRAEFEALRGETDNKALTDEAREKKKEQAEEKLSQVIEFETSIREKAASRKKQIEGEGRRIHAELAKAIRATVKAQAEKDGYTLVLEQSGLLANGLEPVLYAEPKMEITDAVLKILNAERPAAKE
jgi:Skp family chaperone for outer membrane proteins